MNFKRSKVQHLSISKFGGGAHTREVHIGRRPTAFAERVCLSSTNMLADLAAEPPVVAPGTQKLSSTCFCRTRLLKHFVQAYIHL